MFITPVLNPKPGPEAPDPEDNVGVILGLYRDNGKENGNYYSRVYIGLTWECLYFYLWLRSKTEGQMTKPFACAAADAIQLLFLPLRARERRNGMQGYPSLEIMRVLVSGSIPPFLTS